jgi:hypothetical protein
MMLTNGGVLRIDNGGVVTNNAVGTGNWWRGTNGTVYVNSGGTFVTTNKTMVIGYEASSKSATVRSTDSLGGSWTIGSGGLYVGWADDSNIDANNNELIIDGSVIVTSSGGLRVGYKYASGTMGNFDATNNKLSIQGGARLYTTGSSVIGHNVKNNGLATGNRVTVTGANSLWNLNGSNLTVGAGYGNSLNRYNALTVTDGGVVTNAGAITISSANAGTNYLTVSTGTVYAVNLYCTNGTPTVTLGLGGKIVASGAATITNGVLDITCDSSAPSTCGRMDVTGALNITNTTLNLTCNGVGTFVVATYGSLTGQFSATNGLPAGLSIDYNYQGAKQIAVVGGGSGAVFFFE